VAHRPGGMLTPNFKIRKKKTTSINSLHGHLRNSMDSDNMAIVLELFYGSINP